MLNDAKKGAFNLLLNCMGVQSNESVLLVLEPNNTFYEKQVADVFKECLVELKAYVSEMEPELISDPKAFPKDVADAMKAHDHTLFLSRIGDYVRFTPLAANNIPATNYARNTDMLSTPYATVNNRLMAQLRQKLEAELMLASSWQLQCPLGTDLSGEFSWPSLFGGQDDDLTICLFPVATFKPVPCANANGQVALSRWLMPGGAAKLEDADLNIEGVVLAHVRDGNLESFSGAANEVTKLNNHYDYISNSLDINRNRIHSWHAGINPQTRFDQSADDYLDLWSAISFGSPKYLHFHTCGDEPPGEVAWSVFDPTITIDGTPFWENGELLWLQRDDNKALIQSYEGANYLLEPSLSIGID